MNVVTLDGEARDIAAFYASDDPKGVGTQSELMKIDFSQREDVRASEAEHVEEESAICMFMSVHVAMIDADAVVTQLHHLRPSRHEVWHVKPEIITPGMGSGAFDRVTLSPARDTLGGEGIIP